MRRLEGKVAIITGANSGVGAVTAELFAKHGAKVVISARRIEPLKEIAEKIKAAGGEVLMVPTDISKIDQVRNLVEQTLKTFSKIDILINNAGILDKNLNGINQVDYEDLNSVIDINQKGTIYCISEAIKNMTEGASIVNISSIAGVTGGGGAAYVASKSAIIGVTKHTALRFAKANIRCNAVCPGMILTPMSKILDTKTMDMQMMGAMSAHCDLSVNPCLAEDVANVALFLASPESRCITGQIISTDFGCNL